MCSVDDLKLTSAQRRFVEHIDQFKYEKGRLPTIDDLAVSLQRDPRHVRNQAKELEQMGFETGLFSFGGKV